MSGRIDVQGEHLADSEVKKEFEPLGTPRRRI